jgi:predicted nucleic acid-binding protein
LSTLVPDASVAAKLLFPEPGSAEARAVLAEADGLVAPDLLFAELANVIRSKVRRGETGDTTTPELIAAVVTLPVHAVPLGGLTADALALALAFDHPVYDCYYVAAAVAHDAVLITADRVLYALAIEAGLGERVRLLGAA